MNQIILLTAFQHMVWIVLLIVISIMIYSWTKSKISNSIFSIIITIVIVYLLFIQYPNFVWLVIIGIVVYYAGNNVDIKKLFKDFKI